MEPMKIVKYLKQSPVFTLNSVYESIIPRLNKKLRTEQLNFVQGLVLTALFFEDRNDVTPTYLANTFQTSRGNMSHILSELEYRGYIRRVVNELDARGFKIELRPEGKKKALSLVKFYDRIQEYFEKKIGIQNCKCTIDGLSKMAHFFAEFFDGN